MTDGNKESKDKINNTKSFSSETQLILKFLVDIFVILLGIILINFRSSFLLIPGLIITITGILSFILILTFNSSIINNSINKDTRE